MNATQNDHGIRTNVEVHGNHHSLKIQHRFRQGELTLFFKIDPENILNAGWIPKKYQQIKIPKKNSKSRIFSVYDDHIHQGVCVLQH